MKLTEDSVYSMLWLAGEMGCRACAPLHEWPWQFLHERCINGMKGLFVLGLQGNMSYEQKSNYIINGCPDADLRPTPERLAELREKWSALPFTITSEKTLRKFAKCDYSTGKYTRWYEDNVATLKTIIYCVGQMISEPWGERPIDNQLLHIAAICGQYNGFSQWSDWRDEESNWPMSLPELVALAAEDFDCCVNAHAPARRTSQSITTPTTMA